MMRIAIFTMTLVAIVSMAESAYLGINGAHAFRQADSYSHTLGFLSARGLTPYELFVAREPWGSHAVFDIPLYEGGAALVSKLLKKDPLVAARYLNILLWLVSAAAGYSLARRSGRKYSGLLFLFLFAGSPLFLHYFSAPLPDNLAIALCAMSAILLLREEMRNIHVACAITLIACASAVKSPIPFIFLTYVVCYHLFTWKRSEQSAYQRLLSRRRHIVVLATSLILVVLIEIGRQKLGQAHGAKAGHIWLWYFGSLEMRLEATFWAMMIGRFNGWLPPAFLWIFLLLGGTALAARRGWIQIPCALIPFFAGWLVFSNTYFQHDYYQLPVAFITFVCTGAMTGQLLDFNSRKWPDRFETALPACLTILFLLQVRTQPSLSQKTRTDFIRAAEYAALKSDRVLIVTADGFTGDLPVIGGLLSSRLDIVQSADFEKDCEGFLGKYAAVMLRNVPSSCIASHKRDAQYYAEDAPFIFFRH